MLSTEENELLCRVGPGTPMGTLMRQYWLPGLLSREVPEVNDAIFAELTYHAAYEPQRAIRTKRWKYIRRFGDRELPVLANIDDGPTITATSKPACRYTLLVPMFPEP